MSEQVEPEVEEKETTTLKACSTRGRNARCCVALTLVWFALDMVTKNIINETHALGEVFAGPFLGLVQFRLVHNTGAAWGMFGDSTFLLGIMSLVVCAALTVYLFVFSPKSGVLEAIGVALVVGGGLGNAIDRFTLGYVVDFIEPVFIDFPVFNIADIGVTCGFVLFVAGMFITLRRQEQADAAAALQHVSRNDEQGSA